MEKDITGFLNFSSKGIIGCNIFKTHIQNLKSISAILDFHWMVNLNRNRIVNLIMDSLQSNAIIAQACCSLYWTHPEERQKTLDRTGTCAGDQASSKLLRHYYVALLRIKVRNWNS